MQTLALGGCQQQRPHCGSDHATAAHRTRRRHTVPSLAVPHGGPARGLGSQAGPIYCQLWPGMLEPRVV